MELEYGTFFLLKIGPVEADKYAFKVFPNTFCSMWDFKVKHRPMNQIPCVKYHYVVCKGKWWSVLNYSLHVFFPQICVVPLAKSEKLFDT